MTTDVHLRKLSTIEASMACMHAGLGGNGQVTTLLTLKGEVTDDALKGAASRLVRRYQVLGCCIQEQDGEFAFHVHGEATRIEADVVTTDESPDPDCLLESEVNRLLDPAWALCRFRFIRADSGERIHVLFTRHHAISDAFTTERMCTDFLCFLGEGDARDARDAYDDIVPIGMGADAWLGRDDALRREPAAPRPMAQPIPHAAAIPLAERRSGVVSRVLTPESSERLVGYAKRHGVTVNSLVSAALASAACGVLDRTEIELFCAVSLRGRMVADRVVDEPGCHIAVQNCTVRPGDCTLDQLARTVGDDLRRAIDENQPAQAPHQAIRARAEAMARTTAFFGIGITNMGRIALDRRSGSILVEDFRSAVNRSGGLVLLVVHVSSFRDRLYCVFTYPRGVARQEIVDGIADRLPDMFAAL